MNKASEGTSGLVGLTDMERLRRIVILCASFTRNLAFYRALEGESQLTGTDNTDANFWRTVRGNFLDISVIDWCKLFCDAKDKHGFAQVTGNSESVMQALLVCLGIDKEGFRRYCDDMKTYRDKFIAHLDNRKIFHIPKLDTAMSAVSFYHTFLVTHKVRPGYLNGLPDREGDLSNGYDAAFILAKGIISKCDLSLP